MEKEKSEEKFKLTVNQDPTSNCTKFLMLPSVRNADTIWHNVVQRIMKESCARLNLPKLTKRQKRARNDYEEIEEENDDD